MAGHGVGLGLTVSLGLTEAMQGTLETEETPDGGLTMIVSLPATLNPAVHVNGGCAARPSPTYCTWPLG